MKDRRRRKPRTRKRDWNSQDVDTHAHQPRKLRGHDVGMGSEEIDAEERFSDVEPNATVISPYGVLAFVEKDGKEQVCRVAEALCVGKTSILAPGDEVLLESDEDGIAVTAVRHRRTKLSRPAIRGVREQVVAANVDLLAVVATAARPQFKPGAVDRYLIAAEVGKVTPLLLINKMDLVESEPPEVQMYRDLGIKVLDLSCMSGDGVEAVRAEFQGKKVLLAGQSGVGKSTLANRLSPDLDLETNEVSDANDKGRHTTTTSRLYHLPGGIDLIDTPGMKQLGLWKVTPEEVGFFFPEIGAVAAKCRFRDCTHIQEPGCAVLAGIESGDIHRLRYNSYLRIRESLQPKKHTRPIEEKPL
jgi:ribosome biogenesis GTPase / thiamine phosphate phosphatase